MATKLILRKQPAERDPFELPVHPAANVFPTLPPDELQELASDIREHGLREPIVAQRVDGEAVLLDGRNRRAACQMVGITPALKWLEPDEDPVQFIYSINVARRHLTKGQRAMATARLYPNPAQNKGRGKKVENFNLSEVGKDNLSRARTILHHAPDLVAGVLSGTEKLDAAYKRAIEQRDQGNPARAQRKKQQPPKASTPVTGNPPDDGKEPDWNLVQAWLEKHPIPDEVRRALGISVNGGTRHRLTKEQKLDAAIQAELDRRWQKIRNELQNQYRAEVEAEVKKRLKPEVERLKDLRAEVRGQEDALNLQRADITGLMTREEFLLIRGCLHPDRQPEDQRERFDKAFEIFNRLYPTIDGQMPLASARARGWEKVHPRYKPNTDKKSR